MKASERKELKDDLSECKALISDIKDNHLKQIGERLSKIEGAQKVILIVMSAILGSGVVTGIIALVFKVVVG